MRNVIVTLGPSILKDEVLRRIHKPHYIYRINGAHGSNDTARQTIRDVRQLLGNVPLLIDLPGNKIRTGILKPAIEIHEGKTFQLKPEQVNYSRFHELVKSGDVIYANDSTYKFTVESIKNSVITFLSHSTGILTSGKGMHLLGISNRLPFLFQRDKDLIQVSNEEKVEFVGLSFVRTAEDILDARKLLSPEIKLISKVETLRAVENLNSILAVVDRILVDRGDLSTEIGIERLAGFQNFIVDRAHYFNKEVFLATQFLKNMEEKPIPTIAEIIDLSNTLRRGVTGIQLSEETAIGRYPAECLDIIARVQRTIEQEMVLGIQTTL